MAPPNASTEPFLITSVSEALSTMGESSLFPVHRSLRTVHCSPFTVHRSPFIRYFTLLTELAGPTGKVAVTPAGKQQQQQKKKKPKKTTITFEEALSTIASRHPVLHRPLPRMDMFIKSIDNDDLPPGLLSEWKTEATSMVASLSGGGGGGGGSATRFSIISCT